MTTGSYRNVTFDEIEIGKTGRASRSAADAAPRSRRWLLVSGDVDPFHIEDGAARARRAGERAGGRRGGDHFGPAERRLPGPGTRIVSQHLRFDGQIRVGDDGRRPPSRSREKRAETGRVVFDCEVIAAGQRVAVGGTVMVEAPTRRHRLFRDRDARDHPAAQRRVRAPAQALRAARAGDLRGRAPVRPRLAARRARGGARAG